MSLWRSPLLYFGILLILIAGAALAAPLYIDWKSYRAEIEDYGRELTGRKVHIDGDIRARLFPWPALWLSNVRIENQAGAKLAELMRANQIEMRLALAPLISGKIAVEGIRIDQPTFAIERLATGEGTWQLQPRVSLGDVVNVESVTVSGIEIVDGTIVLADARRGGSAKIEDVDAHLSAPTLAGPWRLRSTMSYGKQRVMAGVTTGKFRAQEPLRIGVRLEPEGSSSGLIYSFDGIIGDGEDGVKGQLKVRPATGDKSGTETAAAIRGMVFKSEFSADFDAVNFDKIEIAPDDVTDAANLLTGNARVRLGSTITVDTNLEAARFDIDEMTGSAGHEYVFSGALFPLLAEQMDGLPGEIQGNVKLSVTSLVFGGEVLDGVKFDAQVEPDRLRINNLEASMPGQTRGRFAGSFLPADGAQQISGDISLSSVSLRDFVNWAAANYKQDIEKVWTGARGKLELTGKLDATPSRARLSDGQFSLDDAKGSGNFLIAGGEQPALSVRVVVDSVNVDRYAPGGLTPEAIDAGILAGAVDLAGKAMETGEFGLKLQADFLTLHGVTGEDIAVDIAANADGIEFRTIEIGRVGDARLDVAGLLSFPGTGVSGAVTADVEATDPRGLFRLLGLVPVNVNEEPGWVRALGPLDVKVSGEARAEDGKTDAILAVKGLAGVSVLDLTGRFKGDHKAWTAGEVHVSGELNSKKARDVAELTGFTLNGDAATPVKLSVSSTGVPQDGMAVSTDLTALGAQAQFAGRLVVDPEHDMAVDGRLAVLAERAQQLYTALGVSGESLSPAAQVLSGEGRLQLTDSKWTYSGVSGTAAGTAYRGSLDLAPADGKAKIGGKLTVGRLHLPWLLNLALIARDDDGTGSAVTFDPSGGLPGDFDVTIKVGDLKTVPGIELKNADITVRQTADRLNVVIAGRNPLGEPLEADVQFRRKELELEATGKLSGFIELGDLLQSVDGSVPLAGKLKFSAGFSGLGRSPSGLITALAGEGEYELQTPVLAKVNPVRFASGLQDLKDAKGLDRLIASVLFTGEMPFATSKGKLTIESGVVRFAKLPVTAEGAKGYLATLFELSSGEIDVSAMLKLDAVEGLPSFEVAYAGHPKALERSRDLAALKSYIGVNVLQKGLDKLEELQREADRLFREEMSYARERVKEQLRRETEERRREEEARRKAEEERLRKEVEARIKAEDEARRLAKELEEQQAKEEARRIEQEVARKLAEEEAKRLAEEAAARTRLEKHIRRLIDETPAKPAAAEPSTQLSVEPPPLSDNEPAPSSTSKRRPTVVVPPALQRTRRAPSEDDNRKVDR